MEIGNQIRQLRTQRGITQEEMATHFGITPQAVSKWERGAAAPDIAMLPEISAYFGVTIDTLFAVSDETRMDRIQNMLWDVRFLNQADVESSKSFLLEKARREPANGRPHELLADLHNHLAKANRELAAEYSKEAMSRDPSLRGALSELTLARNGKCLDWCVASHHHLIVELKEFIAHHPECWRAYLWLLDQLIDDYRLEEARNYLQQLTSLHRSYRNLYYEGLIAWYSGDRNSAACIWEQMLEAYSDEWAAWLNMGDFMARTAQYTKAKEYYRKAFTLTPAPRFVEPLEAIAQICEIEGDHTGAIQALEEELHIFESEWHFTQGETADAVRREITRLQHIC